METRTAHYTGETVVWRGPWHIDIPLDFHVVVNPEEDSKLLPLASMALAQFLSQEYVKEQEAECIISEQDGEED